MPSLMIHLLTANKVNPEGSPLFFVGTLAPDAVNGWKEKDETHFRNRDDRLDALCDLAAITNREDDFNEGALLHLYLDWRWDNMPLKEFMSKYKGLDWFKPYREETSLASAWLFHNMSWSWQRWKDIAACSKDTYGKIAGTTSDDIVEFLDRNYRWHAQNNIGPSKAFPQEFIDSFTTNVAGDYKVWRATQ